MYVRIASTMLVVHRLVGFVVFYSLPKGTAFLGNMQAFLKKIIISKWTPITPTPHGTTLRIGKQRVYHSSHVFTQTTAANPSAGKSRNPTHLR